MDSDKVLMELARFRLVIHPSSRRITLQARSGRLGGTDQWYDTNDLGDYKGFVEQFGRTLGGQGDTP